MRQRGYLDSSFVDRLIREHLEWPPRSRVAAVGAPDVRALASALSRPWSERSIPLPFDSPKGEPRQPSDSAFNISPCVQWHRPCSFRQAVLPGRPIPIAIFLTSFDVGGTERQMVELIRRLDPAEFEVHVGCFHRRGPLTPLVEERAASIAEFPIDGFARVRTMRQLIAFAAWCRRLNFRIVQTCELYSNVFGLPAPPMARVPVRIGSRRELITPDKTRPAGGSTPRVPHRTRCRGQLDCSSRAVETGGCARPED